MAPFVSSIPRADDISSSKESLSGCCEKLPKRVFLFSGSRVCDEREEKKKR